MSLIKDTEEYLLNVVKELGYDIEKVELVPSSRKEFGDFQINSAFSIAKLYHENPKSVSEKIVAKLDNRFINVNIQGAGFINLSFNDDIIKDYFNRAIDHFDILYDKLDKKKIIVDYGGANAAKALHVGHMRSANIGEAVKRLLKLLGMEVIGDVHLGDFGRQAGMLISKYKRMEPDSVFFDPNYQGEYPKIKLTDKDLGIMYPKASIAANEDEDRMNEVRELTLKIEKGDKGLLNLWNQMVEISSKSIKKVYEKLNCHFELWEGEMDSFKYIPEVLEIMKPYLYESEGALVCDVEKETDNKPMPPLMVVKKDGSSIYGTRDLGTILGRIKRFNPDEIWYFTDERQSLYFEQVIRASYKTGLVNDNVKLKHFGFGTINGTDGKPFKTRDGKVMDLASLISLIKEEIEKNIKEEITGSEREEIADILSIATLKYADMLPFRKTDYIFNPKEFASLNGKTGPYVLYSLVRIKSLLNKSDIDNYQITDLSNKEVLDVLIKILEISKILERSYLDATLNYIEEFIYDVLSLYNKFYNNNNILKEEDLNKKKTYLALSKLVYQIIHELLKVLAIDEVEKM